MEKPERLIVTGLNLVFEHFARLAAVLRRANDALIFHDIDQACRAGVSDTQAALQQRDRRFVEPLHEFNRFFVHIITIGVITATAAAGFFVPEFALRRAAGTAAQTRVLIDSANGHRTWTTVGSSGNIIEASWQALADALEYALLNGSE